MENLPNYHFVNADICDGEAVTKILDTYEPDAVINFAAETHVDRSITDPGVFARTNVMGTLNLLNCCMAKWMDKDGNWKEGVDVYKRQCMECAESAFDHGGHDGGLLTDVQAQCGKLSGVPAERKYPLFLPAGIHYAWDLLHHRQCSPFEKDICAEIYFYPI